MEQFMADVRAYAARFGITPSTVIQKAGVGDGSPTLRTVDRLRAYMAKNPPPDAYQTEDAA
jgi:hypothetical protein